MSCARPDFIQDVDGYWYWEPMKPGHWSAQRLRVIAEDLDKANERWDEVIRREIGPQADTRSEHE